MPFFSFCLLVYSDFNLRVSSTTDCFILGNKFWTLFNYGEWYWAKCWNLYLVVRGCLGLQAVHPLRQGDGSEQEGANEAQWRYRDCPLGTQVLMLSCLLKFAIDYAIWMQYQNLAPGWPVKLHIHILPIYAKIHINIYRAVLLFCHINFS